jgi:Ca2+-binding RTX toxin-like protein
VHGLWETGHRAGDLGARLLAADGCDFDGNMARQTTTRCTALLVGLTAVVWSLGTLPAQGVIPKCFGRRATIVGTDRPNRIAGTSGNDVIVALGGSDVIDAKSGHDRICAGRGRDFVFGGRGEDRVAAGGDDDYMTGGSGNDVLDGGGGFDFVDYVVAARGVVADTNLNRVSGQGLDSIPDVEGIFGSKYADTMTGGNSADDFFGDRGPDELTGGGGDDVIAGGRGTDHLDGGDGLTDVVQFFDAAGGVQIDLAANTVSGAETDSIAGFEGAGGSGFDDVILGTDVVDELFGGYGDDELRGRDGDDSIEGRGNDDFMAGDAGNDSLDGGPGSDGADGGDGTDSCTASETIINCETTRIPRRVSGVRSLEEALRAGRLRRLHR